MNQKPKQCLNLCLIAALSHYDDSLEEEQGGFIVTNTGSYEFIPIRNANTNTAHARSLYSADREEFNSKVLCREDDNWTIFASYHTHPKGMRAMPSNTDLTKLFNGFPINYIYSPYKELNRFDYQSVNNSWVPTSIITFHGFTPTSLPRKREQRYGIDQYIAENLEPSH